MNIWVDADACPVVVKDILFRAAQRTQIPLCLIANQFIKVPPSPYIKSLQVESGFDVADNEIVRRSKDGDLVIITKGDSMGVLGGTNAMKIVRVGQVH